MCDMFSVDFGAQMPDGSFAVRNSSIVTPAKVCGYCMEFYMYQDD